MGQFYKILPLNSLPKDSMKHVDVFGVSLTIYNVSGKIYATSDICTHKQCHLSAGFLEDNIVECPCHGGKFDVTSGEVKALPAIIPLKTYKTRVSGEDIEVEI